MRGEKILEALQQTKLINPPEEMVVITDEPKIPGYLCFPSDEAKARYETAESFGQGFHQNRTQAKIRAGGECLERLCLYNPEERWTVATYRERDGQCDPTIFFCYSIEQVPSRDTELTEIKAQQYRWWPVTNIVSGERQQIPAQLIFLSGTFDDEYPLRRERISTGAACGVQGTNHAVRAGLLEALERDACIAAYLTKKPVKRIENLPPQVAKLIAYLERYQLEPYLFDVTTDLGIPTILAITLDHTEIGAAVNVGSRSSVNTDDALCGALLESIHCRRTSRIMMALEAPQTKIPQEDEITSMDQRFYYWHPRERIKDLDFWLENPQTVDYTEIARRTSLEEVLRIMQTRRYHVFVADITLPPVHEAGFEVMKVVIPELHPLYLDERAKALYSPHYGVIPDDPTLKPHPLT